MNWFWAIFATFVLFLLTEFVVRAIVLTRLMSLYPDRKTKTICQMISKGKTFSQKYITFAVLNDDKKAWFKYLLIIYFYRLVALINILDVIYITIIGSPNTLSGNLFFLWEVISLIVCYIYLKENKKCK